jgi:hypothetical protein
MPASDPECAAKGIPEHLHRVGREPDPVFESDELLYRRFPLNKPDLTAAISFKRMSVNRGKYCNSPDDVLWNSTDGGRLEGFGVLEFEVGALGLTVRHPHDPVSFALRPDHTPEPCNYPHTEVVAFAVSAADGTETAIQDIKPPSVKLRFREHLQNLARIALPTEKAGEALSL